jgi:hypothetical protein
VQERGVGLPHSLSGCALVNAVRCAQLHGFRLHAHRDLGVTVGRVETDVPEPAADDVDIDTGLKKMHGSRVAAIFPTT